MKLKIVFTGICSILKDHARIVLPNAERVGPNCEKTLALPIHRAYLRYKLDEDKSDTPPDTSKGDEGALFLDGVSLILKGTLMTKSITYPGGGSDIPDVASMGKIYPGFRLKQKYLAPPEKLSHVDVAALLQLSAGEFQKPNVDPKKKWHFFPPKGTLIRGPLAQSVELHIDLKEDECGIAAVPFGSSDEVFRLTLKSDNDEVEIVIGNTIVDDIFPEDTSKPPEVGPDYHFEIYYRLTSMVDGDCPPIPYFEGFVQQPVGTRLPMHTHHAHHDFDKINSMSRLFATFASNSVDGNDTTAELSGTYGIALGGANCPPSQFP